MSTNSQKVAEMFKDQSEEQIINWIIKNMTREQITSCFNVDLGTTVDEVSVASDAGDDDDLSDLPDLEEEPEIEKIRKYCSGKTYVIHKIENELVYFWYFEGGKWKYYNTKLEDFKIQPGKTDSQECGNDTVIKDNYSTIAKAYYKNTLFDNDNLADFEKTKKEYSPFPNVNYDKLESAINIQKEDVKVEGVYKNIFDYSPVLIESANNERVYYYYLVRDGSDYKFEYGNIIYSKFENDIKEVIDELKIDDTISDEQINNIKEKIKNAAEQITAVDKKIIKEIYRIFPLGGSQNPYFMKDLF